MGVLSVFSVSKFIFTSILLGCLINVISGDEKDDSKIKQVEQLPFCDEEIENRDISRRLLYVTTLDGKLSALDMTSNGSLKWAIETGPGPLLSSSIHNRDLTNNGNWVRMIPSLSGSIYKFDGKTIDAIPITAEELLKSSYKFSDDTVISGGKETRSYGVSSRTGEVIYECSMEGCKNRTELHSAKSSETEDTIKEEETFIDELYNPLLDDIIVVRRQTQTVRAIEPRTGTERWNFSIGQHEVELLESEDCQTNHKNNQLNDYILDLELKVIVPEGIVCAYNKHTPTVILWKHKFSNPIVSAWRTDKNHKVQNVDLFDGAQWLWNKDDELPLQGQSSSQALNLSPSLYLGMYQKQLYIQESDSLRNQMKDQFKSQTNVITDETNYPQIPWKPYPATNKEFEMMDPENDYAVDEADTEETYELVKHESISTTAMSVLYASEYVNGNGFYFYSPRNSNDSQDRCDKKTKSTRNAEDNSSIIFNSQNNIVMVSLWYWWKEIIVIALTSALFLNVLINNRVRNEREVVFVDRPIEVQVPVAQEALDFNEVFEAMRDERLRSLSESTNSPGDNYSSRFMNDFDMMLCLGKGGFGVVFEAKNKLDDCNYAIKRIVLPSKQESRERVMREVKTLANCEHKNIVRYFQAWVETPPIGWQEQKDTEWLAKDFCTSITIDSPSPTEQSKPFVPNEMTNGKSSSNALKNGFIQFNNKKDFSFSRNAKSLDDSNSFITFEAHRDQKDLNDSLTSDDGIIFRNSSVISEVEDDSFQIEFADSHCSKENGSVNHHNNLRDENSHVISINHTSTEENTEQKVIVPNIKTNRRPLCLDLTNCKKNIANNVANANSKMYLYIQMQLCMKQSLKDWLSTNDLQTRGCGKAVAIFDQIVCAVHYVHMKGMIHRDLKPSNIFFSLDGEIKIGDFGLVTMCDITMEPQTASISSSSSGSIYDNSQLGQKNHTQRVGTHLYMSPEQSKGISYNYKVDIYSLGFIFFELLVHFTTESERIHVLNGLRNHKFPNNFLENFAEEYELLKLMLSKNPEERPTTYGIRARPPLNKTDEQIHPDWHFELPSRRRDSSINNLQMAK